MSAFTIGAAAAGSGVKVTTIRFYEDRGLMPAADRTAAGRRTYRLSDIARLRFIKHARALGFDLEAITSLLDLSDNPTADCSAADSLARRQLQAVEAQIDQLTGLAAELRRMTRDCTGGETATCHVIESLADHTHCAQLRHDVPQSRF